MVEVLFFMVFSLGVIYAVVGSVISSKLAKHLEYKDGFLVLWNNTQYAVFSFGTLDYSLPDEKSKQLFGNLRKLIIGFYAMFFPLIIITFVTHMVLG